MQNPEKSYFWRGERAGAGGDVLPGGQHVQDDAVDGGRLYAGVDHLGEVAGAQLPGGVAPAEPGVDIGGGDGREVLAPLNGQQVVKYRVWKLLVLSAVLFV